MEKAAKKKTMPFSRGKDSGNVFVTALLATAILVILAATYMSRNVFEYRMAGKSYSSSAALCLAEAGIEKAIWEINYGEDAWTDWTDDDGDKSITVSSFQTSDAHTIGDFTISVTGLSGSTATVQATGYVPNMTSPVAQRTVQVAMTPNYLFRYGIFSDDDLSMTGNCTTDSYDSNDGAYGGANIDDNGDIGSNDDIDMNSNVTVNGTATYGPGDSVTHPECATGGASEASSEWDIPDIPDDDITSAQTANNNANIIPVT